MPVLVWVMLRFVVVANDIIVIIVLPLIIIVYHRCRLTSMMR